MPYGLPNVSYIGYPVAVPCRDHAGLGFRVGLRGDAGIVLDHLGRLSEMDRHRRFCGAVSDAGLRRHVQELWDKSSFVLLAQDGPLWSTPPLRAGRVKALGEIAVEGDDAEIGISVDADLRGRGLGGWLVRTAGFLLAPRGVARIHAFTLADNTAMIGIGRREGARITSEGGEVEIVFDVPTLRRGYLGRRMSPRLRRAV